MRAIFETLGADVKWEGKYQTIKAIKGDFSISLQMNKKDVLINGETIILDVPAKIVNSRTLVPLRFISETFGATVEWKAEERLVLIGMDGITVTDKVNYPNTSIPKINEQPANTEVSSNDLPGILVIPLAPSEKPDSFDGSKIPVEEGYLFE